MKKIFFTAHLIVAIGLLLTGYSAYLNPLHFGIVALAGYVFPLFLVLTVLSIATALFTYKKHLIIPVATLLLAYGPVSLYTPVHRTVEVPDNAISIISYNTHQWGLSNNDSDKCEYADNGRTVMRYLASSDADIVCLQESSLKGTAAKYIDTIMGKVYKHCDSIICSNKAQIVIFSKHPIKRKEEIIYESDGNGSAAFWLDINGKTVIVVNNHLQSTGLSISERNQFADMMHGRDKTIKHISKTVFGKLLDATRIRVPQANAVAAFVRSHRYIGDGTPIIVCGDFNDIPQSYVHHVMSDGMTDCYQTTAIGPGFSFSKYGMMVRIDNVLCTPDITPYNFRVDRSIAVSDHYPIVGHLVLEQ